MSRDISAHRLRREEWECVCLGKLWQSRREINVWSYWCNDGVSSLGFSFEQMKLMKYLFTSRTHRRPSRQENGLVCVCVYFVTGEVAVNEWRILNGLAEMFRLVFG